MAGAVEDRPQARTAAGGPARVIKKMNGLPARLAASDNVLLGYNHTIARGMESGMHKLNEDGSADFLYTSDLEKDGYEYNIGWLQDGKMCNCLRTGLFSISDYRYIETDPATGEVFTDLKVSLTDPDTGFDCFFPLYISCTYDPTDATLWGYSMNKAGTGYIFFTAPAGKIEETEPVVNNEAWEKVCASICYNEKENALVGINRENNLVRIERDGSQTLIMDLGVSTQYARAGLMYDAEDDCYLWNAQLSNDGSYLYCIDPKNNSVSMIADYDSSLRMPFIGVIPASSDPAPLQKPVIDKVDFGKGQNSGKLTFFLPDNYSSGKPLSGELDWTVYLDDEEYGKGSGVAGKIVSVDFSDIETGSHKFSVMANLGDKKSPVVSKKAFIGYDTPRVPTNVTMDATTITWEPVTRGLKGGYMDMANLKYHVYINDKEVGTVVGDSKYVYSPETQRPYAGYVAYIVADNGGQLSDASEKSDIFTYGEPWEMDVKIAPTKEDVMAFSAFDVNQDKNVWSYVEYQGEIPTIREPLASASGTDDWLFSPPLRFDDTATSYEISLDVMNAAKYYKDLGIQVYLCDELNYNNIVEKLIDYTPGDEEFHRVSQVFTVADPGVYYIAFYSKHDAYKSGFFIKDIDIHKTNISAPLPAAVSGLKAEGAPKAELKASVEFVMPTSFINGTEIPADGNVKAYIFNGNDQVAEAEGKPGATISLQIETVQGSNELMVVPEYDDVRGRSSIISVYCGYDVPGPTVNTSAYVSEDNLSLILTWEPPTETGDNGYYVDPSKCEYVVMVNTEEGWLPYETLDSDTFEYTFTVPADNGLKSEWIGIAPSNVAGRATTYAWMSDMLGTPYSLPLTETFKGGKPNIRPMRVIRTYDPENLTVWEMASPATLIGDETYPVAFVGRATSAPAKGCLMLPKFSTEGYEDAGMRLGVWTGKGMADIEIYGETYGVDNLIKLATIPSGKGWQDIDIAFPEEMQNRKWAGIFIMADYAKVSDVILISGYTVGDGFSSVDGVVSEGMSRISGGDRIHVIGHEGKKVSVYAPDGKLVKAVGNAAAAEEISVAPGIYIVTAGTVSSKVIVY